MNDSWLVIMIRDHEWLVIMIVILITKNIFFFGVCRFNQATAMTRHYRKPVLLIEFEEKKSFSLQVGYVWSLWNVFQPLQSIVLIQIPLWCGHLCIPATPEMRPPPEMWSPSLKCGHPSNQHVRSSCSTFHRINPPSLMKYLHRTYLQSWPSWLFTFQV